ncbi:4-hydroxythreonine-4-phosphate dehydrogenase PdxA [bacterium]|nr:4-hydroxythreonine-4-phosphate dehydrogenase PdxA [bacterium]
MTEKLRVGITVGDFNGIGPELILKTVSHETVLNYCTPVIYASPYIFKFYTQHLEHRALDFNVVRKADDLKDNVINLRNCTKERLEITPGEPSAQAGKVALEALDLAIEDIKNGLIQNLLTAPIDKSTVAENLENFSGHTGYLAEKLESEVLMILMNEGLKVAMVTGHTALEEVSAGITQEKIVHSLKKLNESLITDFGIRKPKIAVLGLNPHSGDRGLMGNQEGELISPAITEAQEAGILAVGPYAPDGFFGSAVRKEFDAVLGMYHDQVLIPFKQLAFSDGINYTAGLPMVRTSPDHGTAYDIAGKGVADISSFVNALFEINKIHRNRLEYYGGREFLPFREHRREKFSIGVPDLN